MISNSMIGPFFTLRGLTPLTLVAALFGARHVGYNATSWCLEYYVVSVVELVHTMDETFNSNQWYNSWPLKIA